MHHTLKSTLCALSFALCFTASPPAATINVNLASQGVTIDGFGGFGAMKVWWDNPPFYNQQFLDLLIDTLGLTILRTELYPVPDQQEAWTQQYPYLRAIKQKAAQAGEPFKLYGTVWTAPSSLKTEGSVSGGWVTDYNAYGDYLLNYLNRARDSIGYDFHAISPVNESATCFGYNSMCNWNYPNDPGWDVLCGDLYTAIGTKFANNRFRIPLSSCDHTWGPDAVGWIFDRVEQSPKVDSVVKIVSIHYSDDSMYETWRGNTLLRDYAKRRPWRRLWNTEFGGQFDSWDETKVDEYGQQVGGAWRFARDLMLCLRADFNAVIYWQLCEVLHENPIHDHYSMFYLVNNVPTPGPLFRVAQTVYRHVRPGAVKVGCTSNDSTKVWAVAYSHPVSQSVTVLLYNASNTAQTATVNGVGLPSSMTLYQTSPTQSHVNGGTVAPGGTVNLPLHSITALVSAPSIAVQPPRASATKALTPTSPAVFDISGRSQPVERDRTPGAVHGR